MCLLRCISMYGTPIKPFYRNSVLISIPGHWGAGNQQQFRCYPVGAVVGQKCDLTVPSFEPNQGAKSKMCTNLDKTDTVDQWEDTGHYASAFNIISFFITWNYWLHLADHIQVAFNYKTGGFYFLWKIALFNGNRNIGHMDIIMREFQIVTVKLAVGNWEGVCR